MKTLTLPLKAIYFDQIKAGVKPEEYRLCTLYWKRRLEGKKFDRIVLTKGYPKRDDESRRMALPYRGYVMKTINHEFFGGIPVSVYAIDVSGKLIEG